MTTHPQTAQGVPRPSRAKPRLKYIPMFLEGALNPTLTMEQKGQMLTACAARFAQMFSHRPEIAQILRDLSIDASSLPTSDGELAEYMGLNPDDYQKFRVCWPGFKTVCLDTAGAMQDNETKMPPKEEAKPMRRGKF